MPGGDPRHLDLGQTGRPRADDADRDARQARNDRLRPRHRVHLECDPRLGERIISVDWHYIAPGKPMQNGFVECFNGRMRDELLNETSVPRSRPCPPAHRRLGRRLQHPEAAFLAWLQDTGGLCRTNSPQPAIALRYTEGSACSAGCSPRAERRINGRGSNRRWMKLQWQVIPRGYRDMSPEARERNVRQSSSLSIYFLIIKCSGHLLVGLCVCSSNTPKLLRLLYCLVAGNTLALMWLSRPGGIL